MELAEMWIKATQAQLSGSTLTEFEEDALIKMFELSSERPEDALGAFLRIIDLNPSTKILDCLGAGPLEELLVKNGEYLGHIIELALNNPGLRECLKYVQLEDDDPNQHELYAFVKAYT